LLFAPQVYGTVSLYRRSDMPVGLSIHDRHRKLSAARQARVLQLFAGMSVGHQNLIEATMRRLQPISAAPATKSPPKAVIPQGHIPTGIRK
jgi:hypothetical protein